VLKSGIPKGCIGCIPVGGHTDPIQIGGETAI